LVGKVNKGLVVSEKKSNVELESHNSIPKKKHSRGSIMGYFVNTGAPKDIIE
jgi:hypothetical protein